jgi:phosphotransferase system HPr (HPr) family protein
MEEMVTTGRSRPMRENTTASRTLTVTHNPGLHARPCLAIVNTVRRFHAKVRISNGKDVADAGEILHLMSLGVPAGTEVTLTATGPDATEALDALVQLFQNNFGFAD